MVFDTSWIVGFEGKYSVSRSGDVYSHRGNVIKKMKGGVTYRMYRGVKIPQYRLVCLNIKGKQTMRYVHRLVAEAFCENPDSNNIVNHKDSDKMNNHADNLEWCTNQENLSHYLESEKYEVRNSLPEEEISRRSDHCINVKYDFAHKYRMTPEDFERNDLPNLLSISCTKDNYRQTWEHIQLLFGLIDTGCSLSEIALSTGLDKGQISRIRKGSTYTTARTIYDNFKLTIDNTTVL